PFKVITPVGDRDDLELVLKKFLVEAIGGLADNLIKQIIKIFPEREFVDYADYKTENFLKGTETYLKEPAAGAHWSAGYKSVSIVPDDILTGKYFTAGYFNNYLGQNPITGVLDDQCMRVVALSDGSGRGTAVFVSLDGFSISNANVREFRARLADFIEEKNIVSLNITASHSHYCIDTSGLGVSFLPFIGENILADIMGTPRKESTNEKFMEGLFEKGGQAVRDAVNSMQTGSLYYKTADIKDMIGDKQTPIVFDPNANVIRFVPDNESANEIWLVNAGIHPTSFPRESTEVSSEYPYAIVKYAKELAGADVAFYQGAQNEISKDGDLGLPEDATTFERVQAYGKEIVKRIIASDNERLIEPILNVTHAEIFFPIENPILMAAAKLSIINNVCVHTTGRFEDALLVTEIGYAELGKDLAIAMIPGEMTPEIAWGGAKTAAESWNGQDWKYPPLQDIAGRKLIVFGLTNDQIGYIIPDNEVATTLADALGGIFGKKPYGEKNGHYPEMLSISRNAASYLVKYFKAMVNDFQE
ncbi:MAG TPA: hypothetical protein PKW24_07335, partial [Clostridiales bacterium]|nr:hypothetical protein [Clostridiales bacterium]